jgi:hypothetical protein
MKIVIIPDTQVRQGVPTEHIRAAGNYIVKHKPDKVVVMGDWWDMPSLSLYNTSLKAEGVRIKDDIDAGCDAMLELFEPLIHYNVKRRLNKKKLYRPEFVYITGNHDPQVRIPRLVEQYPALKGMLDGEEVDRFLESLGFEVVPFLEIKNIEGIRFSHYIQNPHSLKGSPLGGQIDTMLKNAGHSFVQGHQQTYKIGKHYLSDGTQRLGIVCGAFYDHDEDYMSPQGNRHWRGIVQLNEVKDGGADVCEISLEYLKREYL